MLFVFQIAGIQDFPSVANGWIFEKSEKFSEVKKPVIETREKIVEIPCVQVKIAPETRRVSTCGN